MATITLSKSCEHTRPWGACGAPRVRVMGYSDGRGGFFDMAECERHAFLPRDPEFAPRVSEVRKPCERCSRPGQSQTVVLPGHDGRQGSPGSRELRICTACADELFVSVAR